MGSGATPWAAWWGEPCERGGGDGRTRGGRWRGELGGGGEGAPISTRRGKPCACATNLPSTSSLSTLLHLVLSFCISALARCGKYVARVAARRKEDRKGRSPLAWNLTLHRWVLSAACSRDTASTISGVVNSRILNAALTLTDATGIGYDRLVATRRCVGDFYDSFATRRCKK